MMHSKVLKENLSNKEGDIELGLKDFKSLQSLIYKRAGLHFEEQKLYFIKKRVSKRANALGYSNIKDYIRHLQCIDSDNKEFQELINSITINETYFFREFDQLAIFGEVLLLELEEEKKRRGDRNIRIWSAACASGEEPYTLAIIIREMLDDFRSWNIEVLGSDINTDVLDKAKKGFYTDRAVRDVPIDYLEKYFTPTRNGYLINSAIKKMVEFKKINFMDRESMDKQKNIDFIFCRNALIYFDEDSSKKVVFNFFNSLNLGGYIFLGHSESISRISSAFTLKRKRDYIVYQKNTL